MPVSLPMLVDPGHLAGHLDAADLRIVDATAELVRPPDGGPYTVRSRRPEYAREHLPGAVFADLDDAFSDPDSPYPFALPTAERFAHAAGALGIGPETHVVAYSQTTPMWSTRLWWLLRCFGFDAVSVLDGGLEGWRAAGLPVDDLPVQPVPAAFVPAPRPELVAGVAEVESLLAAGRSGRLVNALRPPVFRGEGPSSYPRAGRIPGSRNAPWTELVDPATGRFRPPAELRAALAELGLLGPEPVILYCGAGVSATVDLFALALLGRADARLYDGSLTEWTSDPSRPVQVG